MDLWTFGWMLGMVGGVILLILFIGISRSQRMRDSLIVNNVILLCLIVEVIAGMCWILTPLDKWPKIPGLN